MFSHIHENISTRIGFRYRNRLIELTILPEWELPYPILREDRPIQTIFWFCRSREGISRVTPKLDPRGLLEILCFVEEADFRRRSLRTKHKDGVQQSDVCVATENGFATDMGHNGRVIFNHRYPSTCGELVSTPTLCIVVFNPHENSRAASFSHLKPSFFGSEYLNDIFFSEIITTIISYTVLATKAMQYFYL